MSDGIVIKDLALYPVKGCGSIPLSAALITPKGVATPSGLVRDRHWLVVRGDATRKFITQRQIPKLALVRTALDPPTAAAEGATLAPADVTLVLSAPGMPDLRIPVAHSPGKTPVEVGVWGWEGLGLDEGPEAAAWFTQVLGCPAKLVRYGGDAPGVEETAFLRPANQDWAPEGHQIAFADGFPFLVANEASLADLNAKIESDTIAMNRFRPNIIVSGAAAPVWDEDRWGEVRVGGSGSSAPVLQNVKPCSRCKVPTINQETAEVGDEPTRTMMGLRSGAALGWTEPRSFKSTVFFGANMCCVGGAGTVVKVGEPVEVLSRLEGALTPLRPTE